MFLTDNQLYRSQALYKLLKQHSLEHLHKNKIFMCETCNGSGLSATKNSDGSYSWDTHSYCDNCFGVGFIGLSKGTKIDDEHFICSKCNGVGCKCCKMGIVDWVTHLMGA